MRESTRRAAEIARVLTRHGFGFLVDVARLEPLARRHQHDTAPGPDHLRRALEELGPTFVKLGQLLSTRADLIPPPYEAELTRLQDSAPPVPFSRIVRSVEGALGRPIDEAFARFDRVPLAAASIGQVHAAALPDGSEVAVKVRRPDILGEVDEDLELLGRVASFAQRRWRFADRYDPLGLACEFEATLRGELDYEHEGRNADRIRAELAEDAGVLVPLVYWDHTTTKVLTLERVSGRKITDVEGLAADGVDRPAVARRFCEMYLQMVFVSGFFHADPHPGNVFVQTDGTLALVDYGMVGEVDDDTRRALGGVLIALAIADADGLAAAMADLGVAPASSDAAALREDLAEFMTTYRHATLQELQVRAVIGDMLTVVRRHRLRLPHQLAMLLKTVTTCEGVAQQVDPGFELLPVLLPYASKLQQPAD